jgi:hypothetical protein
LQAKWLLLKILLKMIPAGVFTDWQEGACTTTGAHWINLCTLLTDCTQIHSLSVFMLSLFQICWWVVASNNLNHLALQGRLCFSDAWLKSAHEQQWYETECNTVTHYIQPLLALLASPYSSLWVLHISEPFVLVSINLVFSLNPGSSVYLIMGTRKWCYKFLPLVFWCLICTMAHKHLDKIPLNSKCIKSFGYYSLFHKIHWKLLQSVQFCWRLGSRKCILEEIQYNNYGKDHLLLVCQIVFCKLYAMCSVWICVWPLRCSV